MYQRMFGGREGKKLSLRLSARLPVCPSADVPWQVGDDDDEGAAASGMGYRDPTIAVMMAVIQGRRLPIPEAVGPPMPDFEQARTGSRTLNPKP
jgi:hypothetical protein